MAVIKHVVDFIGQLRAIESHIRRNLVIIGLVLFCIIFSYQIIRATTTSIFLHSYGATKSPLVWFLSVTVLVIAVWIFNKWQNRISIHKLFFIASIITVVFFTFGFLFIDTFKIWAYPLFIWKEVYIVILVHMAIAYLNTSIDVDTAKLIYGPIGAVMGFGGMISGFSASWLTKYYSTEWIMMIGCIFVFIAGILFWFTDHDLKYIKEQDPFKDESPLESISSAKKYVFWIAVIIALTQFAILCANFKFNVLFTQIVGDKVLKTKYLGMLYGYVNTVSFPMQLLVVPVLFKLVKNKNIHRFIPVVYLIVGVMGFFLWGGLLLPVAIAFVVFKGVDYSVFAAAKEILYFPLTNKQKYGAKYITDMVVYRASKGLISLVLIYIQAPWAINFLFVGSLVLWLAALIPLFREQKKISILEHQEDL